MKRLTLAVPSRARGLFCLTRRRAGLVLAVMFAAGFAAVPWRPVAWWVLGAAAFVVLVVLVSWRGTHLTRLVRRSAALCLRRRRRRRAGLALRERRTPKPAACAQRVAAVLHVAARPGASGTEWLPREIITSYLDRYGVRCAGIRTTYRSSGAEQEAWVTLVVDATQNLAALQARSAEIPLIELAEATRRRLVAQLGEAGFEVEAVEETLAPAQSGVEDWNGVVLSGERVAAYAVSVDEGLDERLAEIAAYPAVERWTALEFSGRPASPRLAVAFAVRTKGPVRIIPAGLRPQSGDHQPSLAVMGPRSTSPL